MAHPAIFFGRSEGLSPTQRPVETTGPARAIAAESSRAIAFSDLWTHCQPTVRAYLASFLPDPSILDDCLQEVAVIAWRKGPVNDGKSAFLGHCLACARRIGLAAMRKKRNDRLLLLSPDVAEALADTVAQRELAAMQAPTQRIDALRRCIGQLKPEHRKLIEVRYGIKPAGSVAGEAVRQGKSSDSMYKRLERLRKLLRQCVARRSDHTN